MKISKNILTSILAIVCVFSIMIGTIFYAYQYTVTHAKTTNSFQRGNGKMMQGGFPQKGNNKFQGGSWNGSDRKPKN